MKERVKDPERRRSSLIEAVGIELSIHGYSGTGLTSILKRSEQSKGSLFHHFADKEDLVRGWLRVAVEKELREAWLERLDEVEGLEGFLKWLKERCQRIGEGSALSTLIVLVAEIDGLPVKLAEEVRGVMAEWKGGLEAWLQRGVDNGWLYRGIQAKVEAEMLMAIFSGLTILRKSGGESAVKSMNMALVGYVETLRAQ